MPKLEQPLPHGGKLREAIALAEIEHTDVSRVTVRLLLAFFLTAITLVPAIDFSVARGLMAEAASHLRSATDRSLFSMNHTTLTELASFERGLENESLIARSFRGPVQALLTGRLGAGNERVYPGREGWLFYRDDVDYVIGRGFLEPAEVKRRAGLAPAWTAPRQTDPRAALVQFKRDLDARGIALVVMPTPVKPSVHPHMLSTRVVDSSASILQNPSYAVLIEQLKADGVPVFDPAGALESLRRSGPQYLATDTHWRPEAVEMVADQLAAFVSAQMTLPTAGDPDYRIERLEVTNTGDIARMLDLPEGTALLPRETVWLRRVLQTDGSPWRSTRHADVLVLGDSFSNIYTLESMGWGTSAGLVEQLSYALGRPVDRITQNDQGAFATREALARDPSRLNGTRVVIYQFAARELAAGDWKVLRVK